jgi:hypothetical protein
VLSASCCPELQNQRFTRTVSCSSSSTEGIRDSLAGVRAMTRAERRLSLAHHARAFLQWPLGDCCGSSPGAEFSTAGQLRPGFGLFWSSARGTVTARSGACAPPAETQGLDCHEATALLAACWMGRRPAWCASHSTELLQSEPH